MPEVPDTAAPTAEVTADQSRAEAEAVGPSRAEYILGTARATLARCRGNNQYGSVTNNNTSSYANAEQFRERPADVTGVSGRSRGRPLAQPRDRTQPPQTPDTSLLTWEQEREAVFEAISGLRQLCEALSDELAAIRWRQLGSAFKSPHVAFGELSRWAREDRAQIETAGHSRDDQKPEAPAAAHPAPDD